VPEKVNLQFAVALIFNISSIMEEVVNIRPAVRSDCVAIVGLIRELATYEKMLDQAVVTPDILANDGFDVIPPYFQCLVAEIGGGENTEAENSAVVVGFALYFTKYSTWEGKALHLEDFYVTPTHRSKGIGTKLLKRLAKIAVDGGFARLTLECLEWNKSAIDYYKRFNAVDMTETEGWHVFRFTKSVLPSVAGVE